MISSSLFPMRIDITVSGPVPTILPTSNQIPSSLTVSPFSPPTSPLVSTPLSPPPSPTAIATSLPTPVTPPLILVPIPASSSVNTPSSLTPLPPSSTPPALPSTVPPPPSILPPSSNSSLPHTPSGSFKNNNMVFLIGGLVGGLIFLILILILGILVCKCCCRRTGRVFKCGRRGKTTLPGPPISCRNVNVHNFVTSPMSFIKNPISPETRAERLERIRLESEEVQRLRDTFQLDLESRGNSNALSNNNTNKGLDTADAAEMRAQIQQMSLMFAALQAEVMIRQHTNVLQSPTHPTTIEP